MTHDTPRFPDREHCFVCGGPGVSWLETDGRELRRCQSCGVAWIVQGLKLTPKGGSIYEDAEPGFFNESQADYYRDDTAVEAARAKLAWIAALVPAGALLLDVGANLGLFVREASTRYDASGIEPSDAVVDWARRETGAVLRAGSIYDDVQHLEHPYDVVTLFDVIEHLPDADRALANCARLLKPGGYLFLTTPDASSVMARLLGRHWHYVDMIEHVTLFSRRAIQTVLERNGFDVLSTRTIGRGYRFSYIRRRLHYLARQGSLMTALYTASWPLALWPGARVPINLGDVMGIVARRR